MLRIFRVLILGIAVSMKVAFIFKCTCDNLPRVHDRLPSVSIIQRAVDSASGRLLQICHCMLWTVCLLVKTRQNIFCTRGTTSVDAPNMFLLKLNKLTHGLSCFIL